MFFIVQQVETEPEAAPATMPELQSLERISLNARTVSAGRLMPRTAFGG